MAREGEEIAKPSDFLNSDQLELLRDFQVQASGKDTLQAFWEWQLSAETVQTHLRYAQIFYQPEGSSNLQRSPLFHQASVTQWQLPGLNEDTNYRVCIRVLKHSNFRWGIEKAAAEVGLSKEGLPARTDILSALFYWGSW